MSGEIGSAQAGTAGGRTRAQRRARDELHRARGPAPAAALPARRRELALHDLGGFVFESHRLGESRDELLARSSRRSTALDDELAKLQHALELREELAVLHEPGIASCPHCATIHDSAANYCPGCGRATAAPRSGERGRGRAARRAARRSASASAGAWPAAPAR